MTDWAQSLEYALHSGNPDYMKAILAKVPDEVREAALQHIAQAARAALGQGAPAQAIDFLDQLVVLVPEQLEWHAQRANTLLALKRHPDARDAALQLIAHAPEVAVAHLILARAQEGMSDMPAALAAYRQARVLGGDTSLDTRIVEIQSDLERRGILDRMIQPEPLPQSEVPVPPAAPPTLQFEPALFEAGPLPESLPAAMVEGLRQHLLRYSSHQAAKNVLARLSDPAWMGAWDRALAQAAGAHVRMHGSELGVLAVRAQVHGAASVNVVEPHALPMHIASGVVRKNLLAKWHTDNAGRIADWSEEERRASFDAFARSIALHQPEAAELAQTADEWLVLPDIDHGLLSTGVVSAIARHRALGLVPGARILPGRARVFAMGIQWAYPGVPFDVEALNEFRWSFYPESFDWPDDAWTALTAATEVATLDFSCDFVAQTKTLHWPTIAVGRLDAIVYWFELELGAERYSNAPGSYGVIKPAVQYVDAIAVESGADLVLDLHIGETRLFFQTRPPITQARHALLPSWYVPMILDLPRLRAYDDALQRALAAHSSALMLDIGAGCGLLSMLAARAGAERVYGCEIGRSMCRVGDAVLARNGFADTVTLVNDDCRRLAVPQSLPQRADLIVFEMFDCSLIGEGVLHYVAHAREHLATPDARYLPRGGGIRAMLVEYRVDRVLDVEVNLLNPYRYTSSYVNVDADRLGLRVLSAPFSVFDFDFATATPQPQSHEVVVDAVADGIVSAVLFWFELELDDEVRLSTAPGMASAPHWKQGLQCLPEIQVQVGMPLPLQMRHDGSSLGFRWKEAELPQASFSRLPRLDVRVEQQAVELESQTQRLLQHCHADPQEYARVAELASRFAIDPGRYGLDPRIAQRFAASFFGQ